MVKKCDLSQCWRLFNALKLQFYFLSSLSTMWRLNKWNDWLLLLAVAMQQIIYKTIHIRRLRFIWHHFLSHSIFLTLSLHLMLHTDTLYYSSILSLACLFWFFCSSLLIDDKRVYVMWDCLVRCSRKFYFFQLTFMDTNVSFFASFFWWLHTDSFMFWCVFWGQRFQFPSNFQR